MSDLEDSMFELEFYVATNNSYMFDLELYFTRDMGGSVSSHIPGTP